jgi:glycosyltransferase involved in cell wall biosynthesis
MDDLAGTPRARIYTTWGTVLYIDAPSGQLRHGAIETSPDNAVFVADPTSTGERRQGWMMHASGEIFDPIVCGALSCRSASGINGGDPPPTPTRLELVPLERGLIAFRASGLFLCAQPDGRLDIANPWCSTWECFLASQDWCSATPVGGDGSTRNQWDGAINRKEIAKFIVDARLRAKANTASKATKILIFGYTSWSHGRVYYDLCTQLQKQNYIIDIINWQERHNDYIGELLSFYDFVISALDGISILVDVYAVPYDRIIALSHHELDIRALIDQKGIEVFEKFAGYGVVSYQLYDASAIFGVTRHPLVVQLGVNFDEFYAELPERLATVGYAGSYSHKTIDGIEIKRGDIAEAAVREAGLAFKVAGWTGDQISFHDMPDFYKSVDAVLIASVTEGAQMPVKEGAAAGRLVISTPVGDFPLRASQGVGIVAPIEGHKYLKFVADTLKSYKENPAAFTEICRKTQDAARQLDWPYMIDDWVELIETAKGQLLDQARAHQQAGRFAEAAGLFATRAGRGGDDEERWYARWQHARCLRELGDEEGFVRTALQAFRGRPHRAEPLHDLAHYYLATHRAAPAAFYAEAALAIPMPEHDVLSVDTGLYETGLRHTFAAIATWSQDPGQKERGSKVCDWLALSRDVPGYIRFPARYNSGWYAVSAASLLPSLQFHPLSVAASEGFHAANVAICRYGDGFVVAARAVNYNLSPDGYHNKRDRDEPYRSRVLLLHLDRELSTTASVEAELPEDLPMHSTAALGFEDPRPFVWRDQLWCVAATRQLNEEARAEMVLARIDESQPGRCTFTDWRVLASGLPVRWEKNWMPQVVGDGLRFICTVDPTRVLTEAGVVLRDEPAAIAAEDFRGGSLAIPFDDGWLMVIHQAEVVNDKRRYLHRVIWFDGDNIFRRLSRPFYLRHVGYEFVAGIAWHPDGVRILISFSVHDADPHLAVVAAADIRAALSDVDDHRRASEEAVVAGRAALEIVTLFEEATDDLAA